MRLRYTGVVVWDLKHDEAAHPYYKEGLSGVTLLHYDPFSTTDTQTPERESPHGDAMQCGASSLEDGNKRNAFTALIHEEAVSF